MGVTRTAKAVIKPLWEHKEPLHHDVADAHLPVQGGEQFIIVAGGHQKKGELLQKIHAPSPGPRVFGALSNYNCGALSLPYVCRQDVITPTKCICR
jgi:hypothetical protein